MSIDLNETSLLPRPQLKLRPMSDRAILAFLGHISPKDKALVELISDPVAKQIDQLLVDPASVTNPSLPVVLYAMRFIDDASGYQDGEHNDHRKLLEAQKKNAIARQCEFITAEIARNVRGSNQAYCV